MKKNLIIAGIVTAIIALAAYSMPFTPASFSEDDLDLGFPEDIHQVLKTSCFDCHTAGSKNEDAKKELSFTDWNDLEVSKKIGKLDKICELVTEGKMPTEKYLTYYPDRKLTEEQISLICAWAEEESTKLMGE